MDIDAMQPSEIFYYLLGSNMCIRIADCSFPPPGSP